MKFIYADFIASLSTRINTSLPGMDAHVKMAPMHRKSVKDYLSEVNTYRTAAVLALLFPDNRNKISTDCFNGESRRWRCTCSPD
jgi:hypothetical protein